MSKLSKYYRYEITNSIYKSIGGEDSLKEARAVIKRAIEEDKAHGFNSSKSDFHIFALNRRTGERLEEVTV